MSTGQLARDCDELQYDRGSGPSLHAATSGERTEIADTLAESRWADYCRRAAEHGARGSLSVPLPMSDELAGALNIYVREPDAFDDDVRTAAMKFAPYAAVAVANEHAYDDARNMADNLTLALENRAVIDQAKGILMERYGLSPEQAFDMLARVSIASNRKLRAIAEVLVRTGELPGLPRQRTAPDASRRPGQLGRVLRAVPAAGVPAAVPALGQGGGASWTAPRARAARRRWSPRDVAAGRNGICHRNLDRSAVRLTPVPNLRQRGRRCHPTWWSTFRTP